MFQIIHLFNFTLYISFFQQNVEKKINGGGALSPYDFMKWPKNTLRNADFALIRSEMNSSLNFMSEKMYNMPYIRTTVFDDFVRQTYIGS